MSKKKIALYVEGQTEQVLLNHFIQTWWNYSDVSIQNLKLHADGCVRCKEPNFPPKVDDPDFLIIDVDGVGSLPSSIADRANQQHALGYKIIGLRDLDSGNSTQTLKDMFKQALSKKGCKNPDQIPLFFAIMETDAWLLAFTDALSKWSRRTKEEVVNKIATHFKNLKINHLEQIPNPAGLRARLRGQDDKRDSKSYDSVKSLITPITRKEIQEVYDSQVIPSFNQFWDKLTSPHM